MKVLTNWQALLSQANVVAFDRLWHDAAIALKEFQMKYLDWETGKKEL
jgi:hypothetical protein